jgi:NADH:ubiquinone oxidoreductase subunit 6 (subunit J)
MFLRENWFILLPTVLGFIAVYWLLPTVRRSRLAWGAAVGGLALVLGGILLTHGTGIWPETLLFYSFATVAVLGGVMLITHANPVYAALSFAMVVLSTCGLFLLNGAPFLTVATIIVYAGAIVVTFLFVIMLAQQSGVGNADLRSREPFLASVAGFVLLASLLGVLHRTFDDSELNEINRDLERLSEATDMKDVDAVLGPVELKQLTPALTGRLRKYLPDTDDAAKNYAAKIELARVEGKVAVLKDQAGKARKELAQLRAGYGTVAPPSSANAKLPRENVAALGTVLFTDYLVPVELAAVLLLVATIGAIAIANRREGGLR